MSNKLLLSITEVNNFLLDEAICSKQQKAEILSTIWSINQVKGRKWIFSHDSKEYIIDEYNEYNDFIKTYTFRV